MKKKFKKFLCLIFACMFCCFTLTGCIGDSLDFVLDLLAKLASGDITEAEFNELRTQSLQTPMYGTKVLYRADNYDFDSSVGDENADYYGQFAWDILYSLTSVYGNMYTQNPTLLNDDDSVNSTLFPYSSDSEQFTLSYDVMRYQLSTINNVTTTYLNQSGGTESSETSTQLVANTSAAWNWSVVDDGTTSPVSFMQDANYYSSTSSSNGSTVSNYSTTSDNIYTYMNTVYSDTTFTENYFAYILGSSVGTSYTERQDSENYSDYVKALEYAIYAINLNVTPADMSVELTSSGAVVTIDGYTATADSSSVDLALADMKANFDSYGTYVGITDTQLETLADWILDNIIGSSAASVSSTVYFYDVSVTMQDDGSGTYSQVGTNVVTQTGSITITRNYSTAIDAILDAVTSDVFIGGSSADDTGVEITNKYPSSAVVDYYGNDFFISSDDDDPFGNIEAHQYQSMVLMFSEEFEFSNLMLGFKYDAGADGDDIVDETASITINVHINKYTYSTGSYTQVPVVEDGVETYVFQITVNDGEFVYGEDGSTLMMFGLTEYAQDGSETGVIAGEFNTDIGDGVLKSIEEYDGKTSIGEELLLTGSTQLRNYYKLVETDLDTASGTYTSSAVLNYEKFSGSDGCDYVEIAFEIVRVAGDFNTNYNFYTGILLIV